MNGKSRAEQSSTYELPRCRLRGRDYSRSLASELDVKVSLHPAQASRRPCEGPVSSQQPAGYTIRDRSRCPYGEGSTSGTRPPPFATPSVSIPLWFSCRDTAGKSARLRVG